MVEQQHVERIRLGVAQRQLPGRDLRLVARIVDQRKAAIGGAGTVLVGRLHRGVPGGEVHGVNIEAAIERVGVARAHRRSSR